MPRLLWAPMRALACAVLSWSFLLASPAGWAAEGGQPTIAIIDMQQILRESKAVQDMQRKIEQLRASYQGEFREKEEMLRQRDQELARQRSAMSAEGFAQGRQQLEREVAAAQRDIQERRKSLEALFQQGMAQVRLALVTIVQDIAKQRDVDLVLTKTTVVLVRPDLEITEETLEKLDQTLPSFALPVSDD